MEEKEIWKDIEGYKGKYQVSNRGNVKSLNYRRTGKERILKPDDNGHGYLHVQLWKDGKVKRYLVHRLVACAFIPNPNNLPQVNHLSEDKTDNSLENLEWVTCSENINHGTHNKKVSEKLRGRKQTEEHIKKRTEKLGKPVIAIDKRTGLILEFVSSREAERETGIPHGSIIKCCKGKMNSCGGFYWMYVSTDDTE